MISISFTLGGAMSDYGALERVAIKATLATSAGVDASAVTISLVAGSVIVSSEIVVASQSQAATVMSQMASSIMKSPAALQNALTSQFRSAGLATDSLTVQEIASFSSSSMASKGDDTSAATSATAQESSGGGMGGLIAGVVGGLVVLGLGGYVMCKWQAKKGRPTAAVAPEPVTKALPKGSEATKDNKHPSAIPTALPDVPTMTPVVSMGGSLSLSSGAGTSAVAKMTKAQALLKSYELDAIDLIVLPGDDLGEGGQAVVRQGFWRGIKIAVKQPKAEQRTSKKHNKRKSGNSSMDSFAQAIRREVRALSRIRHPNIIKLYGAVYMPFPMLVMAFAPSGTLQDALDDNQFQSPVEVVRLLAGIARGMEAVHTHKIIHLVRTQRLILDCNVPCRILWSHWSRMFPLY